MSKRRRASAKRARSSGDAEEVLEQSESEDDDVGCEPGIKDIDSESSGCSVDTDIDSDLESAIERQAVAVASELQKKTRQMSALALEKAVDAAKVHAVAGEESEAALALGVAGDHPRGPRVAAGTWKYGPASGSTRTRTHATQM